MTAQNQLISQLNLTVSADWSRIRKVYTHVIEKKDAGSFEPTKEPYNATLYSLGNYGCVVVSTSLTEGADWNFWSGKLLESFLPPNILALRDQIQSAGLHFTNFVYYQHRGSIQEHIDQNKPGDGNDGHCAINFIISANDPNATTVAHTDNCQESYKSIPGTTWLLNTAVPHRIDNNDFREVLQIRVLSSYQKTLQFFSEKNMIA